MPGSSLPHLGGEVPDIPVPVPDEVARLAFEVASSGASPLPTTPARSSSASTLAQLRHMTCTCTCHVVHAQQHVHVHVAQRARHGRTSDWAVSRLVTACARHHGSAFAVGTLQEMVKLLRCADRQLPCKRDFVRHMKLRSPQASSGTMATPRLRTPAASPRCRPGADAATPAPSHCHRPSRSHRRPRDHPPRWSVQAGQLPMAQLLVKEGANLHVRDREQWTPLHYACHGALRPSLSNSA